MVSIVSGSFGCADHGEAVTCCAQDDGLGWEWLLSMVVGVSLVERFERYGWCQWCRGPSTAQITVRL